MGDPLTERARRRRILLAASALLAAPTAAQAQKALNRARIGVLRPGPDDAVFRQNYEPFRQALHENGFIEGQNLTVDYRVRPGGSEQMLALAGELVKLKVDAILAIAPSAVNAAARATGSIPVVAVDLESDPIAAGLAANLARPGKNVTGLFLDFPELTGKWIEFLRESVSRLARLAVLWDPTTGPSLVRGAETSSSAFRIELNVLKATGPGDLSQAFRAATAAKADALLILSSPVFNSARRQIAELAVLHRLPAIMPFPGFADDGGLLAYGPHLTAMFRQAGTIMLKVLRGLPAPEIPIERPTRFELVVNLRTAKTLGITIPRAIVLRADRSIE